MARSQTRRTSLTGEGLHRSGHRRSFFSASLSALAIAEFWGARVSRASSGVPPKTVFGGTPNTTRGDACAPQNFVLRDKHIVFGAYAQFLPAHAEAIFSPAAVGDIAEDRCVICKERLNRLNRSKRLPPLVYLDFSQLSEKFICRSEKSQMLLQRPFSLYNVHPNWQRKFAAGASRHDLLRLVETDPGAADELVIETDEPGILVIIRGAGLSACGMPKPQLPGACRCAARDDFLHQGSG